MKIAVIGVGNIGGRLGTRLAAAGHDVSFGVREPQDEKAQAAAARAGANARVTSVREAAAGADVVALAVPWAAVPDALASAGDLSGKILIDCTNRVPPKVGETETGSQEVARLAPGARVVKTFNYVGAENLSNPQFGSVRATAFICGDDAAAKTVVAELAEAIGFDAVDAGPLSNDVLLNALLMPWFQLSRQFGREMAFALLRR